MRAAPTTGVATEPAPRHRAGREHDHAAPVRDAPPGRRRPPTVVLLLAGCIAVAALTLLLPSTPSYDPWAWIGWGRDIIQLDLDTTNGPSWKPLPVLFTTLFAPFGSSTAPALWLVVARAGALMSLVLAFRVARRLAGGRAGWVAGAIAVAGVALIRHYWVDSAGGFSEGITAALLLGAIDAHLHGRTRIAVWLAFGAALTRPESWPIVGAYWLWVWLRRPERRLELALLAVSLPVLWFVPELIASGDLLRGQKRAQQIVADQPALAKHPLLEFTKRAIQMILAPIWIGTLAATAFAAAAWRRAREQGVTLAIAAATFAWFALVGVMSEFHYSGNIRYVFPVAAIACVLGGVGWVRLGAALGRRTARRRVAVGALAVLVLAATYPFLRANIDRVRREGREYAYEVRLVDDLHDAVRRAGGARRVLACGPISAEPYHTPVLAWYLDRTIKDIRIDVLTRGIMFRAPATLNSGAAPPRPRGFATVARAGQWEVLARCGGGGRP